MLLSWVRVEDNKLWHTRKLAWTMICGYADPKKLPSSEIAWWPLMNDPRPKPLDMRKVRKLHKKFMTTKWVFKGKLKNGKS